MLILKDGYSWHGGATRQVLWVRRKCDRAECLLYGIRLQTTSLAEDSGQF